MGDVLGPIGFLLTVIILVALSYFGGMVREQQIWHREMLNHGFAEYNQTNGNWQWKSGGGK